MDWTDDVETWNRMAEMSALSAVSLGAGVACLVLAVRLFLLGSDRRSPARWIAVAMAIAYTWTHGHVAAAGGQAAVLTYRLVDLVLLGAALIVLGRRRKRATGGGLPPR